MCLSTVLTGNPVKTHLKIKGSLSLDRMSKKVICNTWKYFSPSWHLHITTNTGFNVKLLSETAVLSCRLILFLTD